MKVIIINGSAKSGKDQFVKYFTKHYIHMCINLSTIDKVKKISKKYFGWNGKKTDDARKFLSDIKKIWTEYNNGPFNDVVKKIFNNNSKLSKSEQKYIVYFIHCREPEEIQKFKEKYNNDCITLLLKKDDIDIPNNSSDINVNNYNYDFIIDNNENKKELENKSIEFIKKIKTS